MECTIKNRQVVLYQDY